VKLCYCVGCGAVLVVHHALLCTCSAFSPSPPPHASDCPTTKPPKVDESGSFVGKRHLCNSNVYRLIPFIR